MRTLKRRRRGMACGWRDSRTARERGPAFYAWDWFLERGWVGREGIDEKGRKGIVAGAERDGVGRNGRVAGAERDGVGEDGMVAGDREKWDGRLENLRFSPPGRGWGRRECSKNLRFSSLCGCRRMGKEGGAPGDEQALHRAPLLPYPPGL